MTAILGSIRIALQTLRLNPLRTMPSTLGIVDGLRARLPLSSRLPTAASGWPGKRSSGRDFQRSSSVRRPSLGKTFSNHELEVKVKATDAALVVEGFQKVANRIATGLILAALIVGASLLMQVRTTFTIWGYPGLAMMCFLAAAAGGLWLVISIAVTDRKKKKT